MVRLHKNNLPQNNDRTSCFQTKRTAQAAFLTPTPGEQERRYFYALMLRSRGRKSLDISGLVGAFLIRQGIYTFSLKLAVLLRNKSTAKE